MQTVILDEPSFASTDAPTDVPQANGLVREANQAIEHVQHARKALYLIAALMLLFGVYFWLQVDPAVGIGNVGQALFYAAVGYLTVRSPKVCLTIATGLYLLDFAYVLLFEGASLTAIGVRVGLLYIIGRGVRAAYQIPDIADRLVELGGSMTHRAAWQRLEKSKLYSAPAPASASAL